jgi:ABC-type transporter Mla MlaB component
LKRKKKRSFKKTTEASDYCSKLKNNIKEINFERIQKLDSAGASNLCNSSF